MHFLAILTIKDADAHAKTTKNKFLFIKKIKNKAQALPIPDGREAPVFRILFIGFFGSMPQRM